MKNTVGKKKPKKKSLILTSKELEVIGKKLKGSKMNQQDYNYLSKYVRPKLKEISTIDAENLLNKLRYTQKGKSIEKKIKEITLKNLKDVEAIILYGSAIQNNYTDYNDVDCLIVTKKSYKKRLEKYKIIKAIKDNAKKEGVMIDAQILSKKELYTNYPHSPSLIYQLKDCKTIYGKLEIPRRIELYNINLKMKMDWTEIEDNPKGIELYRSLRNVLLVRLLLEEIIDNKELNNSINNEIGKNLALRLKSNTESKEDRKIAKYHLKRLIKDTDKKLGGDLWERKVLLKV